MHVHLLVPFMESLRSYFKETCNLRTIRNVDVSVHMSVCVCGVVSVNIKQLQSWKKKKHNMNKCKDMFNASKHAVQEKVL